MALNFRNLSAAASLLAASSMAAIPAAAAELPHTASQRVSAVQVDDGALNYDRRWRGYRRHRGPDAGDVIAGVLVLGGIAAIASAAAKSSRERQYRDRYPTRAEYDYDRRDYQRYDDRRGIEGAVDICVGEVERGRDQVETVDEAVRDGSGWHVRGELSSGESYSCQIDNDGRLRNLSIRDDFVARYEQGSDEDRTYVAARDMTDDPYAVGDRGAQWSDDAYARARAGQGQDDDVRYQYREAPPASDEQMPAYPGGPLPGDEQNTEGDGRYGMAGV